MSRKHIIAGTLLLLIMLLIVLQIRWQKQAYEIERNEHYTRVLSALNKVRLKLKNANSCVTFFSKPGFMPHEGMYILKQKWDEGGYYGKADTIPLFLDNDDIKKKNEIDYQYSNYKSSLATYAELTLNIIYSPSDTIDSRSGNEHDFKQIIKGKNSINEIFDTSTVFSFIKEKLREENIDTLVGFGFIDIETNKINLLYHIADSSSVLESQYEIDVFRNDRFISPQRLVLVFDRPTGNSIRFSPAILSIFVILLLCGLLVGLYVFFQKQKKLSDLKSEFIQNLNHEMNTPITNIQLAIEWMKQYTDQTNPEIQKLNEIILSESNRLQQNIDRSLQIGMIENNTLLLNRTVENVNELTIEICEIFRTSVENEGGQIKFISGGSYPAFIDKVHFTNCLSSLLDNAIKYRSNARALVVICRIHLEGDEIIITIEDNGRGMSKEARQNAFEKFYREDAKLVHNTKGFGIGLSYVKGVIEMHQGAVTVKSEQTRGSVFEIRLPLYKAI